MKNIQPIISVLLVLAGSLSWGWAGTEEEIIRLQNDVLQLTVKDSGRGFDPGNLSESEGLGLAGMRERAGLASGTLTILSEQGKGTTVSLDIPMGDR